MNGFAILNSRKRGIIALIHSVAFLILATWQMVGGTPARGMLGEIHPSVGTDIVCGIYVVVSSILLWLFAISRGWMERAYFLLCTVSASSGLLRTILGDQSFFSARYIRVVMLTAAVVVGMAIVRGHSQMVESKSEV